MLKWMRLTAHDCGELSAWLCTISLLMVSFSLAGQLITYLSRLLSRQKDDVLKLQQSIMVHEPGVVVSL